MAQEGDTLGGKYLLDRLLGEGGMGAVFAATNTWTGKRVAIKTLHAEHLRRPTALERFWQEARAATKIEHPGIVEVFDFGVDEPTQTPFIVQELLQGQTLRQLLDGCTTLAPREAVELLIPVVEALVAAHQVGVVHRDLKPDNLFLAKSTRGVIAPKLIDFGISKLIEDVPEGGVRQGPKTGTGFMLGTASYMSPEQAAGQHKLVDAQTDVWAIGVVLYEVLTGRLPFEAETDNLTQAKIIYEAAVPIGQRDPSLPRDLAAIVDGTLVRDRARRCASAAALLESLRGCSVMNDGAVTAPRVAVVVPETIATTAEAPKVSGTRMGWDTPAEAPIEARRDRRGWVLAVGVVAVATVAAVVGVQMGSQPRYTVSAPMVVRSNPVAAAVDAGAARAVPAPIAAPQMEPAAVAVAAPVAPVRPPVPVRPRAVTRPARPATTGRHARPRASDPLVPIGTYR
jgi:serine/threonine-protein kinase